MSLTLILGVSTGKATPAGRLISRITSAASASCGTHLGDTKLVASMAGGVGGAAI